MSTPAAVGNRLTSMRADNIDKVLLASVKPGPVVATKLSVGVRRYRAKVLHVYRYEEVDVRLINYENEEHVFGKDMRRLSDAGSLSAPPVATKVTLASVVVPNKDNLNGMDAGE